MNDHDTTTTVDERTALHELATRVESWAKGKGLSDAKLLQKYRGLGSTKTFRKILERDFTEMDLTRQLGNYQAVWAIIESGHAERAESPVYDDLRLAAALRKAYVDARGSSDLNRVVLMLADSGGGKTSAQKALRAKWGAHLVWVEASAAWGRRPAPLLRAILRALGTPRQFGSCAQLLDDCIATLRRTRVGIVIEEAHHLRPEMLDTIKTLVNQTPGEFVLIALPSLWDKLSLEAYFECRQLLGNRLASIVQVHGVAAADVRKLVVRRLPEFAEHAELEPIVTLLAHNARSYGNLAFVRDVIAQVREALDDDGAEATAELVSAACTEEIHTRTFTRE